MACTMTQSLLQCFPYLTLISLLLPTPLVASAFPTSLPGCPDKCGNITIPYPFGTLPGCYQEGFHLTCNDSFSPPKPILGENIEVLDINITTAEARVLNYISYDCYKNETNNVGNYTFPMIGIKPLKPFLFSNRRNKFTVIGCSALALISAVQDGNNYSSGCYSFCDSTTGDGGSCSGLGCCQISIPQGLNYYEVQWNTDRNYAWSFNPCNYAMLVQEDWYNFSVQDLRGFGFYERNMKNVPIVLDWAIRENGTCLTSHVESSIKPACVANRSICDNTTHGEGYICKCLQGYEGNPYHPAGCTVYLDPECLCSQIVTKSSDVYSFGVVILELITRKKAIYRDESDQRLHLASQFVSMMSNGELNEMLDKEIVTNDDKMIEVLQEISDLAVWCLSAAGDNRPTMRQVVEKLQYLVRMLGILPCVQIDSEESQSLLGEPTFYTASDTTIFPSTDCDMALEIDTGSTR